MEENERKKKEEEEAKEFVKMEKKKQLQHKIQ